jgi:hypothetical protein
MNQNVLDIEDAEVISETPVKAIEVEAKKPLLTVKIDQRSPFTPMPFVFLGVGDVNKRYQAWLNQKVKDTLGELGEQTNKKGQIRKRYAEAVSFMRTLVFLADSLSTHENFELVYTGVPMPKKIDFTTAVRQVVSESKELFLALKGYYAPEVKSVESLES